MPKWGSVEPLRKDGLKPAAGVPSRKTKVDRKPDDPEGEAKRELSELEQGFIARAQAENARMEAATDSEYWCCLVFQSREQLDTFIAATGWGDVDERYHDGQAIAKKLGVALPPGPKFSKPRIDSVWAGLSTIPERP